MTADTRTTVRRFTLVTVVLPAVITAIALALQLGVLSQLPDPVATHWGLSGEPNGFAPVWVPILVAGLVGLGIPLLIAATCLPSLRRGDHGTTYRLMGAIALATTVSLMSLGTGTLLLQVGLSSATEAGPITLPLLLSAGLALGAGLAGWYLQPSRPWHPSVTRSAEPLDLGDAAAVIWLQSTQIARGGRIVLVSAIVLVAFMTVITILFSGDPVASWIMVASTVLLIVVSSFAVAFHVRVDADGLSVTSVFGWPRVHVPLENTASAAVVQVNPMGEFGGWGLRWAGDRFGVVLRGGEAIEVTRRTGKVFVVTVDDAQTGAGLLEALVRRAQTA